MEHMNVEEFGDWLLDHGFSEDVVEAFAGERKSLLDSTLN